MCSRWTQSGILENRVPLNAVLRGRCSSANYVVVIGDFIMYFVIVAFPGYFYLYLLKKSNNNNNKKTNQNKKQTNKTTTTKNHHQQQKNKHKKQTKNKQTKKKKKKTKKKKKKHIWFVVFPRFYSSFYRTRHYMVDYVDVHQKCKRLNLETKDTLQIENGRLGFIETLNKQ